MKRRYEHKLLWILLGLIIIGPLLFGANFLSLNTLLIFANQLPEYGLISLALLITLIVSGMNLSVVSMATLSGIMGAIVMNSTKDLGLFSVVLGILVMILVGGLTGLLNGLIISYLEVSPIIATLGTMLFFQGAALNLTKGGAITSFDSTFTYIGTETILGIPIPMVLFLGILTVLYVLLGKRDFGLRLYRIGLDPEAARYSGIHVKKMIVKSYVLAGLISGMTGLIMAARYNSIRVDYGSSYLLYGMVVVSLGGVSLKGGRGTVEGVFISLLIISVVIRLMNLAYVDANIIEGVVGLILLLNLVIQHYKNRVQVTKTIH